MKSDKVIWSLSATKDHDGLVKTLPGWQNRPRQCVSAQHEWCTWLLDILWPCVQRTEGIFGTQWVPSVKYLDFCHLVGFRWVRGAGHCHISDSHEFGRSQGKCCHNTWYNYSSAGISCPAWVAFPSTFSACKVNSSSIMCPEWFIYGVLMLKTK